jgi:hypothetical protein
MRLDESRETLAKYKLLTKTGQLSFYTHAIVRKQCPSTTFGVDSCHEGYGQQQFCHDGLPPDLNGYLGCDRPALKQCSDESYVDQNSFCPLDKDVCTDYNSCYNYAFDSSTCSDSTSSSVFEFSYNNPSDFIYQCSSIDESSPDNPDNGGNADGNPNNDPISPQVPTVSEIDLASLATAIDSSLRDDFGNVERAIRESSSDIESAIRDDIVSSEQNTESLEDTISTGSSDIVDSVNNVRSSIDFGNATLAGISQKLDHLGPCQPTEDNNHCQSAHGLDSSYISSISDALSGTFEQEKTDTVDTFNNGLDDLKEGLPFSNDISENDLTSTRGFFTNLWSDSTPCIPIVFGEGHEVWSITIGCEVSDMIKVFLGFIFSVYTILQLIEIVFNGIQPRPVSN